MTEYYDRAGNKITLDQFASLMTQPEYVRIAKTKGPGWMVSTVWLGLDHSFGGIDGQSPLIFETMAFIGDDGGSEMLRATSEEDAKRNHDQMVAEIRRRHEPAVSPWPGVVGLVAIVLLVGFLGWLVLR